MRGGARRVVDLDLPARQLLVVGLEALHQPLHAQLHRRAHADARDVRHRAQQQRGAPAADQHVALHREVVDLLGGEDRDGLLVGRPALDLARLALADAADEALLHLHACRPPRRPPRGAPAAARAPRTRRAPRPCRAWPSPASSRSRPWSPLAGRAGVAIAPARHAGSAARSAARRAAAATSVVIVPTSELEKKIRMSPCDISIDWRNESSARSPRTSASTRGASG